MDDGAVPSDTGLPGRARRSLEELRGPGSERLAHSAITHGDVDDIGNVSELAAATGAEVWSPGGDRPCSVAGRPRAGPRRLVGAVVRVRRPVDARDVTGGDRVDPLLAGATPGRTPGHLAYRGPCGSWLWAMP